jgi:hypothetical protein
VSLSRTCGLEGWGSSPSERPQVTGPYPLRVGLLLTDLLTTVPDSGGVPGLVPRAVSDAADQVDKTPHAAAWVAARWRAISYVLLVQLHRVFPGLVVALSECAQGTISKSLGTAEKLRGTALRCLPLKARSPVLEMKDEPELYAWVRDSQFDAVPVREVDRLRKVWMLITVEDAPDLIVGPSPPSLFLSSFYSLCLNSTFDQLQGGAP